MYHCHNVPVGMYHQGGRKAFDTVSHLIMFKKLSTLGLSENTCRWFESYLTARKQCTLANNHVSDYSDVIYGVPQGSVMGPVLFSIYVNSLGKCGDFDITLYADDAVITCTSKPAMDNALVNISNWCLRNSLTINESKTKWMLFNGEKNDHSVLILNNVPLERVNCFPYLGLNLDIDMKFVQHRRNTVNNTRHRVSQLARTRHYSDIDTGTCIYKTMVLPSLDYVDYIWDRGNIGENLELQYIQNKCFRIIYKVKIEKDPLYNTNKLHKLTKCKFLSDRRAIHLLFYAYQLAKMDHMIDKRSLPTRRHTGKRLIVPQTLKPIVLRSALYKAIHSWNNLKPSYTLIDNVNTFKIAIKKDFPACFM